MFECGCVCVCVRCGVVGVGKHLIAGVGVVCCVVCGRI